MQNPDSVVEISWNLFGSILRWILSVPPGTNVIEPRLLFDPLLDFVLLDARGRGTPMSSRYHLLQTDDTYLWAAAGVSITVILVVLAL